MQVFSNTKLHVVGEFKAWKFIVRLLVAQLERSSHGIQSYPLSDLYGQRGDNSKEIFVSFLKLLSVWLWSSDSQI